jgi:hypothetical protein
VTIYLHALGWALAIIGLAVLNACDVISNGTAQSLFMTLPVLAMLSINARGRCVRHKEA